MAIEVDILEVVPSTVVMGLLCDVPVMFGKVVIRSSISVNSNSDSAQKCFVLNTDRGSLCLEKEAIEQEGQNRYWSVLRCSEYVLQYVV